MMAAPFFETAEALRARLPVVRGPLLPNAPLAAQSWFRVGGPAEILFKPQDQEDLSYFLNHCPSDVPITVIGLASNLLIRDGGVPGVVIKLGPAFGRIAVSGDVVEAGAASVDANVAKAAEAHQISGLEFLSGIPGSIGGALRMNAGAYGAEVKDVLIDADAMDRRGQAHHLPLEQMKLSYRACGVPREWVFLRARLQGRAGEASAIKDRMQAIAKAREATQPIRSRTGGSTFANPPGQKAWQLIDAAGCRGLQHGGAQVSEQHCNFILNHGKATAADIENLGETVRRRVLGHSGIVLRWEIQRVGIALASHPIEEMVA